jgi:hypothetical protein
MYNDVIILPQLKPSFKQFILDYWNSSPSEGLFKYRCGIFIRQDHQLCKHEELYNVCFHHANIDQDKTIGFFNMLEEITLSLGLSYANLLDLINDNSIDKAIILELCSRNN